MGVPSSAFSSPNVNTDISRKYVRKRSRHHRPSTDMAMSGLDRSRERRLGKPSDLGEAEVHADCGGDRRSFDP
jgi:hypothetical protein